jgi:hypothetical protein
MNIKTDADQKMRGEAAEARLELAAGLVSCASGFLNQIWVQHKSHP